MTTKIQKLALGTAAAVLVGPLFAGTAALAGDYNGGLKDMRGSYVPVPAPTPIPEHRAQWYLRADVGVGFNLDANASENGMRYGNPDFVDGVRYTSQTGPFGMNSVGNWGGGEDVGHIFGGGIGYYISPKFRIDLTGEVRMEKESTIQGGFRYWAVTPPALPGDQVRGTFKDQTKLRSWIFMANTYYDMNRTGQWNPYIGAGLGFSVNQIHRTHQTNLTSCDAITDPICQFPTGSSSYSSAGSKDYSYSLAASATAGVTYRLSERTSLDFNYRYLYVGGTDNTMTIAGGRAYRSKVSIDDQHEHYLRAGIRWDIR